MAGLAVKRRLSLTVGMHDASAHYSSLSSLMIGGYIIVHIGSDHVFLLTFCEHFQG